MQGAGPKLRESLQELKDQNKRDMLVLCYGQPMNRNKIFDHIILDQLYILESLEGFPATYSIILEDVEAIAKNIKTRIQDTIKTRTNEEELALQYIKEEQK